MTTFLDIKSTEPNYNSIAISGIPFDGGVSHRPGTKFGPQAIRQASHMLMDGDHPFCTFEELTKNVTDVGDFEVTRATDANYFKVRDQATEYNHLVTLGGDHSITLPLLEALYTKLRQPIALIHFDAHPDTWPISGGQPYGHGTPFYHAINAGLIDPEKTVQIGIRSPVPWSVTNWTISKGVTSIEAETVHLHGPMQVINTIKSIVGNTPTYLSFDIDALDPAFAPGTGTPEVGGLATWQVRTILRNLQSINWVGMDIVEVSPPYDHAEITALAAATIVWEYLALLAHRRLVT